MRNSLFLLFFLSVASCGQFHNEPNPPKITDQHECVFACANLQKLGCEEGNPIQTKLSCATTSDCPLGQSCSGDVCTVSCAQFCIETENSGVWLQPGCTSRIVSCDQLQTCEEKS